MKLKKQTNPFINGFALTSADTHLLHAVPWPTDLGGHGPALCGTTDAPGSDGWVEPETPTADDAWNPVYCSACIHKYRVMYEENDPRLTADDRRQYEHVRDMIG